jgi:ribosomal protein S13
MQITDPRNGGLVANPAMAATGVLTASPRPAGAAARHADIPGAATRTTRGRALRWRPTTGAQTPWRRLAGSATGDFALSAERSGREELALIVAAAAAAAEVSSARVLSAERTARVCLARHVATTVARRRGLTLAEIGAALGRDHSSVHYAVTRIERRAEHDRRLAAMLDAVDAVDDSAKAHDTPPSATAVRAARRPASQDGRPTSPAQAPRRRAPRAPAADTPERAQQRLLALRLATATRTTNAGHKRALGALPARESCLVAAHALQDGAPWALDLTAGRLLRAITGIGPHTAGALCRRARLPRDARLRDVDRRARARLAALLVERARRRSAATGGDRPAQRRSSEQARAALVQANRVRATRCAVKRDLAARSRPDALTRIAALVADPARDPALAQLTIGALLGGVRGLADVRVRELCERAAIAPERTLAELDGLPAPRVARLHAVLSIAAAPDDARPASAPPRAQRAPRAPQHIDAAPLLAWLDELRPQIAEDAARLAVRRARRSGTITPAAVDRVCVLLERPEMPGLLYPDA